MAQREKSDLIEAAKELDEELERLETQTGSLSGAPLKSRKHIERAAKALEELADADDRVNERVQRLVAAVQRARARREAQVKLINDVAVRLQERTELWRKLMERFAELGSEAAGLTTSAQKIADNPTEESAETLATQMEDLAGRAGALAEDAAKVEFDDVAQQSDSVRQQLLSARNKLRLMTRPGSPMA